MPIVDNKALYEKAKKIADEKYSKPSAYKSGFIVKTYKEMGGTYTDDGKPKNLKRWYKERWSDVGNKDYPVLRPTVKVSKKTPLLPSEISNLTEQIQLKQKIKGKKNLPPFISRDISMKGKKGGMMPRRLEGELRAQEQLPEPSRERRPIYTRKQATDFENKKVPVPPEITNIAGLLHNVLPELVHTIYISTSLHSIGWTEEDIFFLAGNDIPAFKRLIIHLSKNPSEYLKSVGSGRMYGGMDRLPQEMLHGISGYLRPPRVHEVQQQFPGYAQGNFALEHGVRERQRIRDRNTQNLGLMNANRQERLEHAIHFVQLPVREQIAEIEGGLPVLHVREMYAMTNANLPYMLLIRYPAIGGRRKGGMPRKDKDIILPPPVEARAVTGEPTRPFEGQEVYADFPEAPAEFSDFTLAEEQREIAQAEQRDQANIDSLFRQFGQLYPLERSDSAAVYNDFTERYLPRRRMNESYVANLPRAERARILNAFLTQRRGMCVASGKPKRVSKWIEHVKAHAKKHGVSYKQAMQDSRRTYVG